MAGIHKTLVRMQANAEQLMEAYPSAVRLLNDAMNEAMPWAVAMKTKRRPPNLIQLERLATQILAILMASLPDGSGPEHEPDPLPPGAKILKMR